METREQLQKLAIRKWRKIQALTIISSLVFWVFAMSVGSFVMIILVVASLLLSLSHEWVIHACIPTYNCDELRKELGRKS